MPIHHALRRTSLALLAVSVVGCTHSPIPVAENFPLTYQKKVRSAGHWELIAQDVVTQTLAMLRVNGVPEGVPIHVALPWEPTTFDTAFREMVITELVQRGQPVLLGPEGAIVLAYNAQLVRHKSPRPDFLPGRFTMLAAGLAAAYGISTFHLDGQIIGGLALAAGSADLAASHETGGPTHTELVLTTSVTAPEQYLARKTDVYYIEDVDDRLFMPTPPPPSTKSIKVTGE
jgi:hypothetical protein